MFIYTEASCVFGCLESSENIVHEVTVDDALEFTIESSSLCLPDDHNIYLKCKISVHGKSADLLASQRSGTVDIMLWDQKNWP